MSKIQWDKIKKDVEITSGMRRIKHGREPKICAGWDLIPENFKLFRKCVRGAANDMVETGKIDYEWMAYYDDHVHNIDGDKEIPNQEIDNDLFKWNVMRVHKWLTGRTGPEWTVERSVPRYVDRSRRIPMNEWDGIVAFKTSQKTKMKDFKKKVLPYILAHPDVTKVYYVKMRIISQWACYELPRLIS
jgi:hypothetical protein